MNKSENGQLTLEQAIGNIGFLIDNYVGKRAEHMALEQSMQIIVNAINANNNKVVEIPKEEDKHKED